MLHMSALRRTVVLAMMIFFALIGNAQAGRLEACRRLPNSYIDILKGMLNASGLFFSDTLFDIGFIYLGGLSFGVGSATPVLGGASVYSAGGIIETDKTPPNVNIHCLYFEGVYYWAQLDLASTSPLALDFAGAGFAHDVGSSNWAVRTDRGCDGSFESSGKVSIDGQYGASYNGIFGTTFLFKDSMWVDVNGEKLFDGKIQGGEWKGQYFLPSEQGCFTAVPEKTELRLHNERFVLNVDVKISEQAVPAPAPVIGNSDESGTFYFFEPDNLEIVVKVLNACALNNRFWVFVGGLTDVRTSITVTDTKAGQTKTYPNQAGSAASFTDTEAFATCPY